MREPLIVVVGGSSSILLPPNPSPPSLSSSSNKPKPSFKHFPAKLSCSSSSSSSSSPVSTTSTSSSSRSPLLMNVRLDLSPHKSNRWKYYAELASKLAEDGKFEDFVMIAETVSGLGSDSSSFVASLNIKLVSSGFSDVICDGGIEFVIQVLSRVQKLGICPSSLFDRSARKSIALECHRILNSGQLEEFVGLMEMLAGFRFSVREFVDPLEVIKMCVEKRVPKLAVRYACILPHAPVLFRSIIHEFGKKRDLVSALIAYEASKCNLNGPNMYICRTIIDVCGLCGNSLKSRFIYEELLAQKVTPNTYVFNSLMNVNALDLSYILHVYKHMQNLGVAPDMTSYNILLKACCLAGRVELAQNIYKEVRDMASTGALKLDVITYSTIIKVFADAKMWQVALKVKEDMLLAGVTPNAVTWSSLITACANVGLVEQAFQIFEEMLLSGCEPSTQCCNSLLYACVEACQYDRAFRIFQSWKENGLQISCLPNESNANTGTRVSIGVEYSRGDGITKLCSDPHRLSFVKVVPFIPTIATYNILMKACGTDYRRAKALMDEMKITGLSPDQRSWSILIDIFGNMGNVGGAIQGLESMRDAGIKPDVVAYTTAIKACVANEKLDMAFSLFEEMKVYQLQPNLVTYNTLLKARSRYGSLHEVQQSLAISQHMQKAGYSSNDYFLKDLVEEWCEGVIQNSSQNEQKLGVGDSRDKIDIEKSHRLLLNKVAVHLQKDITESISVDLRGLTKVEARIVVLAVLRMIKESYALGNTIKEDMVIILGIVKEGSMNHESDELQASVVKLLRDELGLDVILTGPRIPVPIPEQRSPLNSDQNHENLGKGKELVTSARRPATLGRLTVTKNSLYSWLQKRVGISSSSNNSNSR